MKVIRLFLALFLLTGVNGYGQGRHFVYLQTSNKAPFYVRWNGAILSSTTAGYLIIPQITETTIHFDIGFLKKQWPEQAYHIQVQGKDRGFMIQFGDNDRWNLIDLQTSQPISTAEREASGISQEQDEFSKVLAEVSSDQSQTVKPGSTLTQQISQSQIELVYSLLENQQRKMIYVIRMPRQDNSYEVDTVELILDYQTDHTTLNKKNDTEPPTAENNDNAKANVSTSQKDTSIPLLLEVPEPDTIKAIPGESIIPKDTVQTQAGIQKTSWFMACKQMAEEKDFMQLRKKMAGADTELKMLENATTAFKKKCYTTEQIRHLSGLFLQEDNRYRFFELAYPATSDKSNFALLQTLLNNEQNIQRFKQLIR